MEKVTSGGAVRVSGIAVGLAAAWSIAGVSAATLPLVPVQQGLIITSALRTESGDRENVVKIVQADAAGVSYSWQLRERDATGVATQVNFYRFVRATDLANATRLHTIFRTEDKTQYPGYTAFTFSTAVYDALVAKGATPFTTVSLEKGAGSLQTVFDAMMPATFKLKGTLTRQGTTTFPVLINGRRVQAPALRAHGSFAFQDRREEQDFVLLADRNHPLVLKVVTGPEVLQVIRIDLPVRKDSSQVAGANEAEGGGERMLAGVEAQLQSDCRAELPGIYFDFAAATLTEESRGTIASLAQIVGRHPEWQLSIEGHTDDIGTDADNLNLSQARAQAVITSLTRQHGVDASRLAAKGFGESQPREPNPTLEGRARNRRVEVVRPCK
jgi:outer membrane protein OmpA-like peptidoglycan-associated protein